MLRLLVIFSVLGGLLWLRRNESARSALGEAMRDASDHVTMFLLRSTSGFGEEAPAAIQVEDQQRRLRWR